jgi:hypothetical protein
MSVESASEPPAVADPHREVVETYRSVARWVVSSFGAVAGALVVGVQLSSVGKLHGSHLVLALLSVAVLFIAILAVIGAAVRVLAPVRVTAREFNTAREFKPLRDAVARGKVRLGEGVSTLEELVANYDTARKAQREIREEYELDQRDENKQALIDAKRRTRTANRRMMQKVWLGRALRSKRVFKQSMLVTFVAVPVAAIAATSFAYQSSMPTEEKPKPPPAVHVSVNQPKTCVDLYLALDGLADDERHIGSHWPTSVLGAQDQACGFHNVRELARFLVFLSHG